MIGMKKAGDLPDPPDTRCDDIAFLLLALGVGLHLMDIKV